MFWAIFGGFIGVYEKGFYEVFVCFWGFGREKKNCVFGSCVGVLCEFTCSERERVRFFGCF